MIVFSISIQFQCDVDPIHSFKFNIHDTGSICKALEMNPFKFYYILADV